MNRFHINYALLPALHKQPYDQIYHNRNYSGVRDMKLLSLKIMVLLEITMRTDLVRITVGR